MKRKLLFAERMMYGDGKSPFNGLFPVKISGRISMEQLRHALKRLQEKHPVLNTFIDKASNGTPWFISKEPAVEIPVRTVERVSDDHWKKEAVAEWNTPFNTNEGPLIRVIWLKSDITSDILVVFHHCMCDGGSAVALIKELLLLMDKPNVSIGEEQLLTGMSDIVPAAILHNKRKILKARILSGAGYLFLKVMPLKKKPVDRGKDYLLHWKLGERETAVLIGNCKAAGITVNTAMALAILSAFKEVRKKGFFNKITCPVEIRKYAPEIKKDSMFAFGLMLVLSMDKDPGLDFIAKAKKMQELAGRKRKKLNAYETLMMFEYAHPLLPRMIDFLKYGKSTNDCMFSNMGVLDIPHQYESFTVDTIYSPTVIGPLGNTTTWITSTFKKRLDCSFVSSEGYLSYENALAIKEKAMQLLAHEMISSTR